MDADIYSTDPFIRTRAYIAVLRELSTKVITHWQQDADRWSEASEVTREMVARNAAYDRLYRAIERHICDMQDMRSEQLTGNHVGAGLTVLGPIYTPDGATLSSKRDYTPPTPLPWDPAVAGYRADETEYDLSDYATSDEMASVTLVMEHLELMKATVRHLLDMRAAVRDIDDPEATSADDLMQQLGYEIISEVASDLPQSEAHKLREYLPATLTVAGLAVVPRTRLTGEKLAAIRDSLTLSQEQLAGLLEVNRVTLARWESSSRPIPRSLQADIDRILDDFRADVSRAQAGQWQQVSPMWRRAVYTQAAILLQ